ncbi:Hint domain-containing protein [Litoreibacter ponti]|uniref:Hint domain-containing protein n=1 Tax=Litoreibacter ponti TaxID=1510457 RepID=UPI003CCC0F4E
MGQGCPKRTLCVSPQHRVLVADPALTKALGLPEALVAAKGLLKLRGVRQRLGCRDVEYTHLVFDQHEIIFAEGCPTESFFPGPVAVNSVDFGIQQELREIFPRLSAASDAKKFENARTCVGVSKGQRLLQRSKFSPKIPN